MKILITGATGFIGRNLVKGLQDRYEVICLVRSGSHTSILKDMHVMIEYGDITNPSSIENGFNDIDIAIHLAAVKYHYKPKEEIIRVNVDGTRNLLECCRNVRHFILCSSTLVYKPTNVYSETKKISEDIVKSPGLNYTILRLSPVFGVGDKTNITRLIDLVKKYPLIPLIGNGEQVIQPIYIKDVVSVIDKVIFNEKCFNKTYDICGEPVTINRLVDIIAEETNSRKIKFHIPVFLLTAFVRLYRILNSKPVITLEQISSLNEFNVLDPTDAKNDIGFEPLPIRSAIKDYLQNSI